MGGFGIKSASKERQRGFSIAGPPGLESAARRDRRAKQLGLKPDEKPVGQREARKLSEEAQIRAEGRGEKRRVAAEDRAQKKTLTLAEAKGAKAAEKAGAKEAEKTAKLNRTRAAVGLAPVERTGFAQEVPGSLQDPAGVLANRPPTTATFGGVPVGRQPTLAQAQGGESVPTFVGDKQVAGPGMKPTLQQAQTGAPIPLNPQLQEAVGNQMLTLAEARSRQKEIDAAARRAEGAADKAQADQTKAELDDTQKQTELAATLIELEPDLEPTQFEERLASASARGMSPASLAAEIKAERKEAVKAEKEADEMLVEEKAGSAVQAWLDAGNPADRTVSRRQRENIIEAIKEDMARGTPEEKRVAREALKQIRAVKGTESAQGGQGAGPSNIPTQTDAQRAKTRTPKEGSTRVAPAKPRKEDVAPSHFLEGTY